MLKVFTISYHRPNTNFSLFLGYEIGNARVRVHSLIFRTIYNFSSWLHKNREPTRTPKTPRLYGESFWLLPPRDPSSNLVSTHPAEMPPSTQKKK